MKLPSAIWKFWPMLGSTTQVGLLIAAAQALIKMHNRFFTDLQERVKVFCCESESTSRVASSVLAVAHLKFLSTPLLTHMMLVYLLLANHLCRNHPERRTLLPCAGNVYRTLYFIIIWTGLTLYYIHTLQLLVGLFSEMMRCLHDFLPLRT